MSDTAADVLVAGYQDLDKARSDFDGLVKLVGAKGVKVEGVILVAHDRDGNVMDVGRDHGMTVDPAYRDKAPYPFSGTVKKVVFDMKPVAHDDERQLHEAAQHAGVAAGMSGCRDAHPSRCRRAMAGASA